MDVVTRQARLCAIFSSPVRLRILHLLGDAEHGTGELAELLEMSSPAVSQHLRIMKDRGAIVARREGRHVYYRLANPKLLEAAKLLREVLLEGIREDAREAEEI